MKDLLRTFLNGEGERNSLLMKMLNKHGRYPFDKLIER